MKVIQIVKLINTYNAYQYKIQREKEKLQWELINTGETEKTEQLRKQIAIDEECLGKFLDMEV